MTEVTFETPTATPARTQFAGRASNLLLVLGIAAVGVSLFVVVPSSAVFAQRVMAGILSVVTGAAMLLLSFALDRRRPWAPAAAAAALWIVLVLGALRTVVWLLGGGIMVPLDAIAAAWVLSGSGRPVAWPRASALAWVLVGLLLVGRLGEPVVGALFTPGVSRFAVAATQLTVQLTAACPATGAGADRIRVDGSWTWSSKDVFPSGTDGIGIGWTEAGDGTWVHDVLSGPGESLWLGGGGVAGGIVGRELEGSAGGVTWGVDVDNGGLRDGMVALALTSSGSADEAPPRSGAITIRMVYAHLDRWVVAAETTCSW